MVPRLMPVARQGVPEAGAAPLAGSAHVWFREMAAADDPARLIETIDPAARERFSAPRPPLFGHPLDRPLIMGILNVTPDSFSDGGDHADERAAVAGAVRMSECCDILDIGGESTRPGAEAVPEAEEIRRTAPVIRAIREAGIATPISIDTRKSAVAAAALDAGADMINDVAAGRFDPAILSLAAERGVPICLMHSVADPKTMQAHARYDDVLGEVYDHLGERMASAVAAGVAPDHIILDPGIGFGKTAQHNLTLLRGLTLYHGLGGALLIGASRKRFIGEIGKADAAKDRMAGSVAVALYAADQGAHILRVHDTFETRQALSLHLAFHERGSGA